MKNFELQPFAKACLQLLALSALGYALWTIKGVVVYAGISLYISVLGRPPLQNTSIQNAFRKIPRSNRKRCHYAVGHRGGAKRYCHLVFPATH
jgi:hypothetical protein